jgi:hypothetical protein
MTDQPNRDEAQPLLGPQPSGPQSSQPIDSEGSGPVDLVDLYDDETLESDDADWI